MLMESPIDTKINIGAKENYKIIKNRKNLWTLCISALCLLCL